MNDNLLCHPRWCISTLENSRNKNLPKISYNKIGQSISQKKKKRIMLKPITMITYLKLPPIK